MILVKDNPVNLLQWKDDVEEIVDRVEVEEWGWEFKTIGGKSQFLQPLELNPASHISKAWTILLSPSPALGQIFYTSHQQLFL